MGTIQGYVWAGAWLTGVSKILVVDLLLEVDLDFDYWWGGNHPVWRKW